MSAFKAYDIRGIYGEDINEELAYRIGYFLPALLKTDHVVVGRDIRLSSQSLHDALVKGVTDSGADVWDLGLATTPMVYFATAFLNVDASVQITASHNPKEYNGFKISRRGALPVGGDSGLKDLEKLVDSGTLEIKEAKGSVKDYSHVKDEYISFLKPFAKGLETLNISIDCSSGMSSLLIKDILSDAKCHYINDTFDGNFPAHEPNPLEEKNCAQIKAETIKNASDVGVIYDGDADRVMFIDEKGSFIQPDYITAVIGKYYASKGRTGNALQDIRTSRSSTEYLESLGFSVTTWKVGHAYAKLKIREIDGIFGGELAGHYYFKDFFCCDSGILASLIVLSVVKDLKAEGKTFSSLISSIVKYANSGEVNFRLNDKDAAIKALYERFAENDKPSAIMDFDGYRIEFPTWWFNVRKSNTEPYLRIVAEAKDKALLEEKLGEIKAIIAKFS
ncbi:MAG: phosphomannomutase/phosphoglucomutase [Spirochaetes bacterium]|uniref:Phosphomannomutase/phosphoglucomutase n=1 Tax=Candidatus Ornithospirochaeta stercoripullorum TaxID=2840899 RepID=A0A9D9DZZ1_9SPIO|nr:phosphomannomutase/phosphoglucomutase [Candidatus Ornithospirochaeta stercoripullorum]